MAKFKTMVVDNVTWEQVQNLVDEGRSKSFQVGDEITQELKDGSVMTAVVAAVNLYEEDELIFVMKDCIGEDHCMNENGRNYGGWAESDMRKHVKNLLSLLPEELVQVISPKKTVQILNGEKVECEDMLFMPSEAEVFGAAYRSNHNGIDKQFPYYKEPRNRVSCDREGYPTWKWLSSPFASNSNSFTIVYTDGYPNYGGWANNGYGVCLGFCIRKSK